PARARGHGLEASDLQGRNGAHPLRHAARDPSQLRGKGAGALPSALRRAAHRLPASGSPDRAGASVCDLRQKRHRRGRGSGGWIRCRDVGPHPREGRGSPARRPVRSAPATGTRCRRGGGPRPSALPGAGRDDGGGAVRMTRAILHCDLDAFYASVEQRDHPEYRGKPVIVGGALDERGVVSAASYEARVFGVRSAMPLRMAGRLCPDGIFVPGDRERYEEASDQVMGLFAERTPLVQPISLDEAFLDITGTERLFGGGDAIARDLKRAVRDRCGLVLSVGVATNKLCAKVASDLRKPDGLVVVPPGGEASFL